VKDAAEEAHSYGLEVVDGFLLHEFLTWVLDVFCSDQLLNLEFVGVSQDELADLGYSGLQRFRIIPQFINLIPMFLLLLPQVPVFHT